MGQLPTPMSLTLTLLALTSIASFAVLLVNIQNAPEGHEDENGFHAHLAGNLPNPTPVPVGVKVSTHRLAA